MSLSTIAQILLGITLILWALMLLGLAVITSTLLGIFALVTGIVWVIVALTSVNR